MPDHARIERLESRLLFSTGELIRNGSLEGSPISSADWVLSGAFQADARFATVHSGLGYAYLATPAGGAGNSLAGQMYQQVTIPASAQQLKLSFWSRITTAETTTTTANDLLRVQIWNSTGTTLLHTAATVSNLNKNSDYEKLTYTLPDSLKGQTVRILFDGSTNASLATTFRIDDVGLSTQLPDLSKKVVGYLPSYRQSLFVQMDLNLVSHINYFSVSASASGALTTTNVDDANLATVVNAAHAKGVGVSITVGPQTFGTLAADSTARATFATNIVNYALARNLDGVDIDWEPPATGVDYADYALLIDDLYKQTAPHGLKITAAVNPWTQEIPVAATNQMDWVNVMCYDFDFANHSTFAAAIDGMQQWSDYGVEKSKLLMGTPFYGRSGTSWSNSTSKIYSAFYSEYVTKNGAPPPPDLDAFVDAAGTTWYFNGVTTVQRKMAWVRDNGYGGAMIWELGQDHWDASNKYDQYSLLPVINAMIRPPLWLTPGPDSRFDLVAGKFIHSSGDVTFSANAHTSGNPNLAVIINAGATARLDATQRWSSLSIAAGGKLDITDKDLALNYTGATPMGTWNGSAYTGISGLVQSGYNFGAWNGTGGIVTSMPAAAGGLTTVGLGEARDILGLSGAATDTWNGQQVDATTILIKYTYAGDANLDGVIDGGDYGIIDNFAQVPGARGYWNGDFNFDGVIDGGDYGIIDNNIQAQGGAL